MDLDYLCESVESVASFGIVSILIKRIQRSKQKVNSLMIIITS